MNDPETIHEVFFLLLKCYSFWRTDLTNYSVSHRCYVLVQAIFLFEIYIYILLYSKIYLFFI